MQEIWKDIKGYEGLYQVSNLGRIKSFYFKNEKILKTFFRNKNWKHKNKKTYISVNLVKNQKIKSYFVHKLVAETFLDKKTEDVEINHKNGNKLDNRLVNLEYITHLENIKHSIQKKLKPIAKSGKDFICTKPIKQYDLNHNFIKTWYGGTEINNCFGTYANSNIRQCALGKRKTAYGYKWEY